MNNIKKIILGVLIMSTTFVSAASSLPMNVYLEKDPAACPQSVGTIRRAAFDFGGGSIRVLVADVDLKTKKIEKIFNANVPLRFRLDVGNSTTNEFSQEIQDAAFRGFRQLQEMIARYNPQQHAGVATESFRIAKNGEQLLGTLSQDTGVPVDIISQEEEGFLGFLSAVNYTSSDPSNTVVIDIGTGSVQISGLNEDGTLNTHGLKLGTVVLNEIIAKQYRGLESIPGNINPVTQTEALRLIEHVGKQLNTVPQELVEKLRTKNVRVVATCGIANAKSIRSDTGWSFMQNTILDNDTATLSAAANSSFCYAFITKFGVEECFVPNSNKEGNTGGMLTQEKYWR